MARTPKGPKSVETIVHDDATRRNIPTAELQSTAEYLEEMRPPEPAHYPRARPLEPGTKRERDEDLDPQIIWNGAKITLTPAQIEQLAQTGTVEIGDAQLVWRGKDTQDWSELVVATPPLYIQEKIHPKVIIEDLKRHSSSSGYGPGMSEGGSDAFQIDLFADFNGIPDDARTDFYQHDQHWSNRMILGDSLQVMASLAEREHLAGKVQCIYFDPPYGIKFNSNWQVSTINREVEDGKQPSISREPEQVKAFRDTWKDGINSYLTYLRDRMTVAKELLNNTGSIFLQIGDENVHRVRAVMDEIFGADNFISLIMPRKTATPSGALDSNCFYIIWYAKNITTLKYRQIYLKKPVYEWITETRGGSWGVTLENRDRPLTNEERRNPKLIPSDGSVYALSKTNSAGASKTPQDFSFQGNGYHPGSGNHWKSSLRGMERVSRANRLETRGGPPWFKKYHSDSPFKRMTNVWDDTSGKSGDRIYVVQTEESVIERCLLMATDPGDLVLDPTCGSGTTAYVAEQWGRRWITLDTSRVALALARTRIMSARYPYYLLSDSPDGRRKEQELSGQTQTQSAAYGDIRQGFVCDRVPYVTLKSIANNPEIDIIWDKWQAILEPLRDNLNGLLDKTWQEWEIPRDIMPSWPEEAKVIHGQWWQARIARQKEIDASIAKRADVEMLYDRPYQDSNRVRVAGPFTVESLSPHRVVPADAEELQPADPAKRRRNLASSPPADFAQIVLENLKASGVQQSTRAEKINFISLAPWPGEYVAAEGRFLEGDIERRAAIFIGPEFGTTSRPDLTAAAREATEARFDVLIAAAFNFEAHASELTKLGPLPILKAKINPDLHMAGELKNTGKGNLFIVFGEPDVDIENLAADDIQVRVKGVDVFDPNTGDIRSGDTKSIAAWFIDTDYNEESFFVRHAYFLGASDPYKSLKTALRAEIDEAAWATLYRDVSRPFPRPESGRIAVKVINHFGDEVMKVFKV